MSCDFFEEVNKYLDKEVDVAKNVSVKFLLQKLLNWLAMR